jgi:hypothetical protein
VVLSAPLSFAAELSRPAKVTLPEALAVPAAPAVVATEIVALAPLASELRSQFTAPPDTVQVPAVVVAEPTVTPENCSATADVPGSGPLFCTVAV